LSIATKDRCSRIVELTVAGGRLIERAFQKHANDVQEIMTVLKTNERSWSACSRRSGYETRNQSTG
jgi:DNA-binding MarR family transcriptional regulator